MFRYSDKNGRNFQIYPTGPCYALTDFPSGHVKVYQPGKTIGKWVSNCTVDDIGFYNRLPKNGDTLFICKSYKDARINLNLGFNATIWTQGEHFPIREKVIRELAQRFKRIYVYYDNDKAGITAALHLCQVANGILGDTVFIPLWLPEALLSNEGIKDSADYLPIHGSYELGQLLQNTTNGTT